MFENTLISYAAMLVIIFPFLDIQKSVCTWFVSEFFGTDVMQCL